jgi:hypothetical protein
MDQQNVRAESKITPGGDWLLELNSEAWVLLMLGLTIAINYLDQTGIAADLNLAEQLRALRSALSKG